MSAASHDPATRKKIIILAIVGLAFLGYVGNTFVVKPMAATRKRIAEGQATLQENVRKAEQRIRQIETTRRNAADKIVSLARDVLEVNYALVPRLDNYNVVAQEAIAQWCREVGVTPPPLEGLTGRVIAVPQGFKRTKTSDAFKAYQTQVTLTCSLADVIRLQRVIEAANPFVTLGRISISGRSADPEHHRISFSLQWPVWSHETMHADLQARLRRYLDVKEGA